MQFFSEIQTDDGNWYQIFKIDTLSGQSTLNQAQLQSSSSGLVPVQLAPPTGEKVRTTRQNNRSRAADVRCLKSNKVIAASI